MSRYENLSGKGQQQKAHTPGVPVGGQYVCHYCPNVEDEAIYHPMDKVLVWTCPEGHVSMIEEFDLA